MHKTQFDSSYTAVTKDGAQWLVDHLPSLQLVGIDYTSIAVYSDLPGAHHVLLPRVSWPYAAAVGPQTCQMVKKPDSDALFPEGAKHKRLIKHSPLTQTPSMPDDSPLLTSQG